MTGPPFFAATISQTVAASPMRYSHVFASSEPRLSPLPRRRGLIPEPESVLTCDEYVGPGTYEPPRRAAPGIPGVYLFPSWRPGTAPTPYMSASMRSSRVQTPLPMTALAARSSRPHSMRGSPRRGGSPSRGGGSPAGPLAPSRDCQ